MSRVEEFCGSTWPDLHQQDADLCLMVPYLIGGGLLEFFLQGGECQSHQSISLTSSRLLFCPKNIQKQSHNCHKSIHILLGNTRHKTACQPKRDQTFPGQNIGTNTSDIPWYPLLILNIRQSKICILQVSYRRHLILGVFFFPLLVSSFLLSCPFFLFSYFLFGFTGMRQAALWTKISYDKCCLLTSAPP